MERKLPSRKKKFPKGHAIRISDFLFKILDKSRNRKSWDTFFRIQFGLPDKNGVAQPLIEGILETLSGKFILKMPEAKWEKLIEDAYEVAFFAAAKRKVKRVPKPIRLRELP